MAHAERLAYPDFRASKSWLGPDTKIKSIVFKCINSSRTLCKQSADCTYACVKLFFLSPSLAGGMVGGGSVEGGSVGAGVGAGTGHTHRRRSHAQAHIQEKLAMRNNYGAYLWIWSFLILFLAPVVEFLDDLLWVHVYLQAINVSAMLSSFCLSPSITQHQKTKKVTISTICSPASWGQQKYFHQSIVYLTAGCFAEEKNNLRDVSAPKRLGGMWEQMWSKS